MDEAQRAGELDAIRELRASVEALRNVVSARGGPPGPRPEIDVRGLMETVRAQADADLLRFEREALAFPVAGAPPAPIAVRGDYHLDDLLAFHDEEFVRNAYRAILHREPDPSGYAEQLEQLYNRGVSRVEILHRLRGSPEGGKAGVRVRGLAPAYFLRRMVSLPVLGPLVGMGAYVMRLPVLVRNMERQDVAAFRRDRQLRAAIDALAQRTSTTIDAVWQDMRRIAERVAFVRAQLARIESAIEDGASRAELQALAESALAAVTGLATQFEAARTADTSDVAQRFGAVWGALDERARTDEVAANLQQLERLIHEAPLARKRVETALREGDPELDTFYASFEDRFRGSREEIRERVEVYLPVVREAQAGSAEAPVLDIGCGRGEWLEVLRDAGLAARGVDLSAEMVRRCRDQGLQVEQAEAIEYLATLPAASLGAVTAMHVIEHLSLQDFVHLLDETARVLRAGGVAIFETPNPENLLVGACNFWFDPTHQRPLPPEATRFIAMQRGFAEVEILRLHPYPDDILVKDGGAQMRTKFNQFLFGPQDYAIVARKR